MTKPTPHLNSELPVEKLIELSKTIAPSRYQKYYFIMKTDSVLLNSTRRGTITTHFLDITALRGMVAQYSDERIERSQEGEIPVGLIRNKEYQLRQLWRRHEDHLRRNGAVYPTALPTGNIAEDIACLAVNLKIVIEELAKMRKVIAGHDAKQEAQKRLARQRVGGHKRGGPPDYRIVSVDGMAVDEMGMITETGQRAVEYLAEIRAEKKAAQAEKKADVAAPAAVVSPSPVASEL